MGFFLKGLAAMVVAWFVISGFFHVGENRRAEAAGNPDLEVIQNVRCLDLQDHIGICGRIRNNSDRNYRGISVSYSFYDKTGNLIGHGVDYIGGLGAHETWKFETNAYWRPGDIRFDGIKTY